MHICTYISFMFIKHKNTQVSQKYSIVLPSAPPCLPAWRGVTGNVIQGSVFRFWQGIYETGDERPDLPIGDVLSRLEKELADGAPQY